MTRRLSSVSLFALALGVAGCSGNDSGGKLDSSAGGSGATGSGGTATGGSGGGATGGSAGSSMGGSAGSSGSSTGGYAGGGGKQIGADDIEYLGSFDVPTKDSTPGDESSFAYGGKALGY